MSRMFFLVLLVLVVTTLLHTSGKSTECDSFDDVNVQVVEMDGRQSNETVNGCLERKRFHEKTVTAVFIIHQKIPRLGKDSVRHLVRLETISFWGCELDSIEPRAFRNLPRLKNVQISYCDLKEIPKGVFNLIPSMELLRIHNNKIDFIENQAFANLSSLKKVFGSDNALEYWHREWFDDSPNLEIMDFQNNKIRTIPRKAFAALQKLKQIYFDYNEIATIQSEAFVGLKNLEYLGLRNNRLKAIEEHIFPTGLKIRSLLISANYLNYLSNEVLKKISVSDIVLEYNPWKCPCLDRIHYWIYTNNGTLRTTEQCKSSYVPICAYPKSFSQTCLEYVDEELTQRYIGMLRNLSAHLDDYCARLD
ncbi:unnamed protein product [Phaedon cochleariae]|uniref:Uncharacterized protein n=1 Tax=Phaedon cochleariae TaxID=80249 RepID=A0A9P0DPM3_PHACE|nr:unnamed protein product [Phaedon cochleariae]